MRRWLGFVCLAALLLVGRVAATAAPSAAPTAAPSATPTARPTASPTAAPSAAPSASPTAAPSAAPSATPTAAPTAAPTAYPTAAAGEVFVNEIAMGIVFVTQSAADGPALSFSISTLNAETPCGTTGISANAVMRAGYNLSSTSYPYGGLLDRLVTVRTTRNSSDDPQRWRPPSRNFYACDTELLTWTPSWKYKCNGTNATAPRFTERDLITADICHLTPYAVFEDPVSYSELECYNFPRLCGVCVDDWTGCTCETRRSDGYTGPWVTGERFGFVLAGAILLWAARAAAWSMNHHDFWNTFSFGRDMPAIRVLVVVALSVLSIMLLHLGLLKYGANDYTLPGWDRRGHQLLGYILGFLALGGVCAWVQVMTVDSVRATAVALAGVADLLLAVFVTGPSLLAAQKTGGGISNAHWSAGTALGLGAAWALYEFAFAALHFVPECRAVLVQRAKATPSQSNAMYAIAGAVASLFAAMLAIVLLRVPCS